MVKHHIKTYLNQVSNSLLLQDWFETETCNSMQFPVIVYNIIVSHTFDQCIQVIFSIYSLDPSAWPSLKNKWKLWL